MSISVVIHESCTVQYAYDCQSPPLDISVSDNEQTVTSALCPQAYGADSDL